MKQRLLVIGGYLALLFTTQQVQAQSLWNAGTGDWFTGTNWTPTGVPDTNIKAQINNGGTAQITVAGANANTLNLGNGVGQTGALNVSGAGTLTINGTTGFTMIVGEGGTGTLNVSSGGIVIPPVLYIGDLAGSMGTVTVTGTGSQISSQFNVEVGRSGTGTLNILNGGAVTVTSGAINVGNGTGTGHVFVDGTGSVDTKLTATGANIGGFALGSTGDITVTGAHGKFSGGGVDVGSAGDGTLTLSAGATGTSTSLLIGDDGTGTVTLTDAGTTFTLTSSTAKVTVGNTTAGNLNIQAGATLSSSNGTIGQNPGGAGTVTITDTGSSWTVSNPLLIGQTSGPGGSGTINVLNGGKLSAPSLDALTAATIKVDGSGSQLALPNDFPANKSLHLGSVGINKLDVTDGGKLATGSALLTTTASSSLAVNLSGTGSSWTETEFLGTLTTQFGGAGTATFTVSNNASLTYAQDGFFNVDATGTGTASLTVSSGGTFNVGTLSGTLRIGQDGKGSLMIDSGGTVSTGHTYVGEDTGAVGTATVTGAGSTWNFNDLNIGILGGQGTVTASGGATLKGDAIIGGSAGSGQMTVTGAGTTWTIAVGPTNNFVFVEQNGSLSILDGATVNGNSLNAGTGGAGGTILIDGNGTQINVATLFTDGTGTITIQNKAVVTGTGAVLGQNEGANTTVTVDGVGTQWTMTGAAQIGNHGGVTMNIQNGARVTGGKVFLGFDQNTDGTGGNGIVNVTGTGSTLGATTFLRVADFNHTAGTLTVSQGGTVTSVSGGTASTVSGIASTANSTGSVVVTDANSSWTNTGNIYVGGSGTTGVGTLTVVNSGAVTITGATSINATSTLNIGTGGTAGTFSSASVANSGLIHFNLTDSVTYSSPTSGAGTVTKDGAGTVTITGTHTYTGATTVNGGLFVVNGTLGNTAVTVNNGARLGGSGTIGGAVTIANGGILAPGNSPGTITVGSLTLNSGSIENYDLGLPNIPGGATNDLTIVNGNLTLDGTLNVANGAGFGTGIYRLFTYTGALTDNLLDLGSLPGGFTYTIDTSIANQVNLDVTAVGATFTYWNGSHTTPNGTVNGGAGTWNNTTTNWTDVTGTSSGGWASGGVAHFTGAAGTVTLGDNITASEIQFLAGSGAYTITAASGTTLTINGAGVTNSSGIAQNFSITSDATGGGQIVFAYSASAGNTLTNYTVAGGSAATQVGGSLLFKNSSTAAVTTITNNGGSVSTAKGGAVTFQNTATAGNSSITNNAGTVSGTSLNPTGAGTTTFQDSASAGNATITNTAIPVLSASAATTVFRNTSTASTSHISNAGGVLNNLVNGGGGVTEFFDSATAASATIVNEASTASSAGGGQTVFANSSHAGASMIFNHGGSVSGSQGGQTLFQDTATADSATITSDGGTGLSQGARTVFLGSSSASTATLIANGNTGGGTGGSIEFFDSSTGSSAVVKVFDNGQLDISQHDATGVEVGSIEGSGNVFLGARTLTVSNTNTDKTFSGVIQDGGSAGGTAGSFTKTGTGTLMLTGINTYTGATTVNNGALLVNGSTTSNTTVNSGATLGGTGTINGTAQINSGGTLSPGSNGIGTFATGQMTLAGGALLKYELAAPGTGDLTNVTGNLTLDGTLNITSLPGFTIGTYKLFTYSGALTDNGLDIGTRPPGFMLSVDTSIAGEVDLDVAGGGPLPIAYWNGPNLSPNGRVNGGSGIWDNTTTNWTDATGNVFGTWGGEVGIFGGAPGTITLGSDVTFTSLEFTSSGYVVNGAGFALNGNGPVTLTTDAGVSATINANINAPGGATKLGPGSLFLNGSLFGNLQVLQGLLGGHGTIAGNLFNAATVSPGNSPGTLHVSGNYTQTPGALLKIEIGGRAATAHDLLAVGGTANLDGALQLVRLNKFKLKRNEPVTFLTAAGGIHGEFAEVVSDFTSDTILQPKVIYRNNSVSFEGVQGLFADLHGLTPNQKAVARTLDHAASDRRADSIFDYLDYRQLNKLPGDLEKIAPEELTSIFTIGTSLATVQSQNIQRRTDDIRSGASGFSAAGLAVNGGGPSYSGSFGITTGVAGPTGQEDKNDVPVADYHEDPKLGAFLSGTGEWVGVGDTDNARGYNLTSGGFTLGVDYQFTPNFAVGLMAGYTGTSADLTDRGRIYVNGGKIGLYATYFQNRRPVAPPTMSKDSSKDAPAPEPTIAEGFYADLAVTGGYNSYSTRRSALQGEARGDTDGGELNVLVGTGYDFKKGPLTFGPTASFNYTYLGTGEFTEHGSLAPLDIHGGHGQSLRTALGFKASYDWKLGSVLVKPEIRAAWQHEFGDPACGLDSSLANGAGDAFLVHGPETGRDSLLLGGGFAIQFNERLSTYLYYDGELGRKNYGSSSVTAGLRLAF